MKNITLLMFVLLGALTALAEDYPPMDITTIYGQTFKNATVVNVNASTVDISYQDNYNMPMMRGIKLKELTPELQTRFGYDPAAAAENERKQAELRQSKFFQLKHQESELQKKVSLQIQQRQSGQNVPIDVNELYKVIYQGKAAVSGFVISYGDEGALVNITGNDSDEQTIPDNIVILDLDAPARSTWTGYIYPTMLISSRRLPVYCVAPENAVDSVVATLRLNDDGNPGSDNQANAAPAPATDTTTVSNTTTTSTTGFSGIYIQTGGGYYYPNYVYPIIRPCPPRPYPPRPYPPRPYPPRPPHHDDDRPNRPVQNDNTTLVNWPSRVTPSVTPNVAPTVTPSVTPTVTPSVTPSVTPTVLPGVTPTVLPSVTPTNSGGGNSQSGDRVNVAIPGAGTNVIIPGTGNYVPAGTGIPGGGRGNGWGGGRR